VAGLVAVGILQLHLIVADLVADDIIHFLLSHLYSNLAYFTYNAAPAKFSDIIKHRSN
jgi:UDP-N-acetylmuramyl pentapeptide phosphotransferase/UDP-N-acetylglucosamine-1-phosphate transferase